MRLHRAALLLLIIAGLAGRGWADEPADRAEVDAMPAATVTTSLDLSAAADDELAPVPLTEEDLLPTVDADAASLLNVPEGGEDQSAAVTTDADEEAEDVPVDAETLKETEVLTDPEAVPPDDEGTTVQAQEVVYDFPVVENQKVQYYIDYYTGPQREVFGRWLERGSRYLPYMQDVFAAHGLPRDLVYLSIVESGLNPKAYSWAHASGPWQFIRSTGKLFGLDSDYWSDERRDFEKSTEAAARYLKDLYGVFDGNWYLAVAAYNAGAGKVMKAVRKTGSRDFWVLARSRYLLPETKHYLPKLLAVLIIAKQPEKYGFTGLQYQEPVPCDKVTLPTTTDLAVVARLTASDYAQIKALNPELKRWCTPPQQENYEIRIPVGTRDLFLGAYNEIPPAERTSYAFHRVAKGETLKGIAKRYQSDASEILSINSLASAKALKPGKGLAIPLRKGVQAIPLEDLRDDPAQNRLAKRTYKVRKGDTLWKISRRSGVSEQNLRRWNGLKAKSVLRIGQVLVLGPKAPAARKQTVAKSSKKKSAAGTKAKRPASKAKGGGKVVYQVKRGDTLYNIAQQYEVSANDIRSWNGLRAQHVLQPGERLTLLVQGRRGG